MFACLLAASVTVGGCGGGAGPGTESGPTDEKVLDTVTRTTGASPTELASSIADAPVVTIAGGALPNGTAVTLRAMDGPGEAVPNTSIKAQGHTALLDLGGAAVPDVTTLTVTHPYKPGEDEVACVGVYDGGWFMYPTETTDTGIQAEVSLLKPDASSAASTVGTRVGVFTIPVQPDSDEPAQITRDAPLPEEDAEATAKTPGKPLAIVLHGFLSSSAAMENLAAQLRSRGYEVYLRGYWYCSGISKNGEAIASEIREYGARTGRKVDIFAHSMGGLVARSAIEQHGAAPYVDDLVTLGTPHDGVSPAVLYTAIAAEGPAVLLCTGLRNITTGSGFLDDLNAPTTKRGCRYWVIGGNLSTGYITPWPVVDAIYGGPNSNDGLVSTRSSTKDLSAKAAFTAGPLIGLNHTRIKDGAPVLAQIDKWLGLGAGGGSCPAATPPTGLKATAGNRTVMLSWTKPTGFTVASYRIYRSTSATTGFAHVATSQGIASMCSDTGLTNGKRYYYRMRSVNAIGGQSANSAIVSAVPTAGGGGGGGSSILNPQDSTMKLLLVPAGEATFGSPDNEGDDDEHPQFRLSLPGFYIGETEVTNLQYKRFVDATGHESPSHWESGQIPAGIENHPVMYVSWEEAKAYCDWAGLRLPMELEWEKAARGTDGRRYPWGNEWDPTRCRNWENCVEPWYTAAVGSYPTGDSPYGLHDMAGNAWEWCEDWFDGAAYACYSTGGYQPPSSGTYRVLRGGSWYDYVGGGFRCALRHYNYPVISISNCGFRVARAL